MFHFSRALLLIVISLGLVAFGCADPGRKPSSPATTAPSGAPPRVTIDPETRDLGVVGFGEEAVAEFVVTNAGGSPLTLAVPRMPRGLRLEGLPPAVAPGGSARLLLRIDTFDANADRRQTVGLTTNDPERPSVTLEAQIDVRPFLVARPGYARYITVQHAREGTIVQTIGATDGAEFRVLRVESPASNLRVSFREAKEEEREPSWTGSQWRVPMTLDSASPVGVITGLVVVHTDHPRQKRLFIQVSGFVRPVLAATPPEVRVGDLERRRAEPWRIFVRNFAEETIEITEVSTDVAAVRAELEPLQPGRSWRVKLFPVAEAPLGPFEGKILLRTASPYVPSFEIPLTGRLVESANN